MNAVAMQVKSRKRFKVSDFLLEFADAGKDTPKMDGGQSWQKMKFIAQMFVAQANADTKKKRRR
jgi:hypothetical protein